MLAAEALRLAAVEALCPTAALEADDGYPTLAGRNVFDSRQITVDEVDREAAWTPALSVFTEDVEIVRRGNAAPSTNGSASVDLIVTVELCRCSADENPPDVEILDDGDPKARLFLGALCAQVRKALVYAPKGVAFRRLMAGVSTISIQPFSLPQYDLRLMCNVMTFRCDIADDKFTDAAGLPEPMASLLAEMPEGSYARAKLIELGQAFLATDRDALAGFNIYPTVGDGVPAIVPPAD